jgi:DNA-binding NarL/FixJ family response regulator
VDPRRARGAGVTNEAAARPPGPIEVVLVDDHRMLAEGLSRILGAEPDIVVRGVAGTIAEGEDLVRAVRPSVAIVDFLLPDGDGAEATTRLRRAHAALQVLVLTGLSERRALVAAVEAGASGFVTKDRALEELVVAVRHVHAGDAYIEPTMLASLLPRPGERASSIGGDLSVREREVLALLAEGLSNSAIAARLVLSVHTVRNHVQAVLNKLGVHSKLEAVALANREGLLDPRRTG